MNYGEKLKDIRTKSGLSQKDFAEKLNTKQNTLSTYEKCMSEPSISVASTLFKNFNVSPYWFFDIEIPMENKVEINNVLIEKAKDEAYKYGLELNAYIEHLIIQELKKNK